MTRDIVLARGTRTGPVRTDPKGLADARRCIAVDSLAHGANAIGVTQEVSSEAQAAGCLAGDLHSEPAVP
jgi:hypothetical protein